MNPIKENLDGVRKRIVDAAKKFNRNPSDIKLIAVSKTKSVDEIKVAYEAGQRVFGENYAQEMAAKAAELKDLGIEWHFIGHLQKNKAKIVCPVASFIETVDSIELAKALSSRATKPIECLIEVNIGDEESKSGIKANMVKDLAEEILKLPNLTLKGLMIIPPFSDDPEFGRPYFKELKKILGQLNDELKLPTPLTELSMGMSHDFEVAIEEGATIVRVGTAIFGERGVF